MHARGWLLAAILAATASAACGDEGDERLDVEDAGLEVDGGGAGDAGEADGGDGGEGDGGVPGPEDGGAADGGPADAGTWQGGYAAPSCAEACHGTAESYAPLGLGAHAAHLEADPSRQGIPHAAIGCSECHVVPAHVLDEGHIDGDDPAELAFGPLAAAGGAAPSYDAEHGTCSGTWCHGALLAGTPPDPVWTEAPTLGCDGCHGFPPSGGHPPSSRCFRCHPLPEDHAGTHVNGRVELDRPGPGAGNTRPGGG